MFEAIKCAEEANSINEVPVGAIIYNSQTSQIISKSFNKTNKNLDPTAHAEINVIRDACKILNTSRLINCDLYVTLEPCMMCAAAISQARIRRLYFGADDLKYGSINGNINYFQKRIQITYLKFMIIFAVKAVTDCLLIFLRNEDNYDYFKKSSRNN